MRLRTVVDPLGLMPAFGRLGLDVAAIAGAEAARAAAGLGDRVLASPRTSDAVDVVLGSPLAAHAVTTLMRGPLVEVALRAAVEDGIAERVTTEMLDRGVAEQIAARIVAGPEIDRLFEAALESPRMAQLADRALESEGMERLVGQVLGSRLLDASVARALASEELWLVVDEIAQSPAVTAAITRQSAGFADQVAGEVGERSRRADARLERVARRLLHRPPPADGAAPLLEPEPS